MSNGLSCHLDFGYGCAIASFALFGDVERNAIQ